MNRTSHSTKQVRNSSLEFPFAEDATSQWRRAIRQAQVCVTIFSPYCNSMLKSLLKNIPPHIDVTVVTSLQLENFVYGASQIEVLEWLINKKFTLRHLHNLHAKIVLVDQQLCFLGSQNATIKGAKQNLEASCKLSLQLISDNDNKFLSMINGWEIESSPVNQDILAKIKKETYRLRKQLTPIRDAINDAQSAIDDNIASYQTSLTTSLGPSSDDVAYWPADNWITFYLSHENNRWHFNWKCNAYRIESQQGDSFHLGKFFPVLFTNATILREGKTSRSNLIFAMKFTKAGVFIIQYFCRFSLNFKEIYIPTGNNPKAWGFGDSAIDEIRKMASMSEIYDFYSEDSTSRNQVRCRFNELYRLGRKNNSFISAENRESSQLCIQLKACNPDDLRDGFVCNHDVTWQNFEFIEEEYDSLFKDIASDEQHYCLTH